ncbi:MAG: hypothetical protein ACFE9R_03980 [Candidatus Hermodarchaeota archaeon]
MEKEVIKKIENQFPLGSNKDLIKTKKSRKNESNFWKYLDYTTWTPGEIEIENEIKRDYK